MLFNWYPDVIAIGPAGQLWSLRNIIFYGLSIVLWLSYFYAFFRLGRSRAPCAIAIPVKSPSFTCGGLQVSRCTFATG